MFESLAASNVFSLTNNTNMVKKCLGLYIQDFND